MEISVEIILILNIYFFVPFAFVPLFSLLFDGLLKLTQQKDTIATNVSITKFIS